MTHTLDRRQLLALAATAVVPLQPGRHDGEAASIRALTARLRTMYEARDVASLGAVVAPGVVFVDPTFHFEATGLEALQAMFAEHAANILALRVAVERELVLPPWAIVQQTQTITLKTSTGPRTAPVRGVSLYRIEQGRIAEWWDYYDAAGFHKQIAAPAGGAR
jgi:limonene-1,2-epoxide hydrolase